MNSEIPTDRTNKPIEQGQRYVLEAKSVKPVKVEVTYDDSHNALFARKVSDPSQVVWRQGEQNPLVTWRRVEK